MNKTAEVLPSDKGTKRKALFITGAGGFVGREFLSQLSKKFPQRPLVLLLRRQYEDLSLPPSARIILGDIVNPEAYEDVLTSVETVVHLAALTGKSAPEDYDNSNLLGTRRLVEACQRQEVKTFLFISTIAVKYPDLKYYPYAKSKLAAEAVLQNSTLRFTIIRPTIVMGPGSPIADTLAKIAGLPIIPLPCTRESAKVQPVHVIDVARGIVQVLEESRFKDEIYELGGPETLFFGDLLSRMHLSSHGKKARIIPIPLAPIQWLLNLIEPLCRKWMPATAGQLSVFGNDSSARSNWLQEKLELELIPLRQMLAIPKNQLTESLPNLPPLDTDYNKECQTFTQYMVATAANETIILHYVKALKDRQIANPEKFNIKDYTTIKLARKGGFCTRSADAYCSFLYKQGLLRRRLALLAAILENSPSTHEKFDKANSAGPVQALAGLAWKGLEFALALISGVCLITASRIYYTRFAAKRYG